MKCTIAGPNIKTFAKVVHAFAKIGDDIYFEPFEQGLHLKAVNSSRSAYFCITLMVPFFQQFVPSYGDANTSLTINEKSHLTPPCKLTLKSVLLIFKSLASLEKQHIEYLKLILNPNRNKAIFKVHCKFNILKAYHLSYMECDSIEAIIPETNLDSDDESSQINKNEINFQNNSNIAINNTNSQSNTFIAKFKSSPKLLQELISQFSSTVEEITFQVNKDLLIVKNYQPEDDMLIDPSLNTNSQVPKTCFESQKSASTINHSKQLLNTEVKFYPGEFLSYQFVANKLIDITFCMKEFKAALSFLEYVEADITFRIDNPGKPILLKSKIEHFYTATFLLATLAEMIVEEDLSHHSQSQIYNKSSNNNKSQHFHGIDKKPKVSINLPNTLSQNGIVYNEPLYTNDLNNEMDEDVLDDELSQIYPQSNIGTQQSKQCENINYENNMITNINHINPSNILLQKKNISQGSPINFKMNYNKECLIVASDSDD